MKKYLLMLILLLLVGCSSQKYMTYDSVKDDFEAVEVDNPIESSSTFDKNDYLNILDGVKDEIEALTSPIDKDNLENAKTLYTSALLIEKLSNSYSNQASESLKQLSTKIKELVIQSFEEDTDLESSKNELNQVIDAIYNWDDLTWLSIEKRNLIKWDDIKEEYEQLEENAKEDMIPSKKINEAELEELKDIIVNNYELLAYGISDNEKETANKVYAAAIQLKEYTRKLKGNTADKVYNFANQTLNYVIKCYGGEIDETDYDFLDRVTSAKKWSLSTWNEIVTLLRV